MASYLITIALVDMTENGIQNLMEGIHDVIDAEGIDMTSLNPQVRSIGFELVTDIPVSQPVKTVTRYVCTECDQAFATFDAAAACHHGIGGVEEVTRQVLHIDPPDDVTDHWCVTGDLREVIDMDEGNSTYDESTNYDVRDMLLAEGCWSPQNLDPEYSCFFGYANSEDEAIRLLNDAMVMTERLKEMRA